MHHHVSNRGEGGIAGAMEAQLAARLSVIRRASAEQTHSWFLTVRLADPEFLGGYARRLPRAASTCEPTRATPRRCLRALYRVCDRARTPPRPYVPSIAGPIRSSMVGVRGRAPQHVAVDAGDSPLESRTDRPTGVVPHAAWLAREIPGRRLPRTSSGGTRTLARRSLEAFLAEGGHVSPIGAGRFARPSRGSSGPREVGLRVSRSRLVAD